MQPFIIFTLARTGSTTLVRLLNCCPGLRCAFEPFSPTNIDPALHRVNNLRKTQGLDAALQLLWQGCNGFKHVWRPEGWPFVDNPFLNQQLLTGVGARIVLLHRRNELRRAISVQISEQMQVWTPNTDEEFRRIREHHFAPLDIEKLRAEMVAARSAMGWARERLERAAGGGMGGNAGVDGGWMEVAYEDLFGSEGEVRGGIGRGREGDYGGQLRGVLGVVEFLRGGMEGVDAGVLEGMRVLLDPAATGFRNAEAYERISNIREVDRELGSDETGWALK